jgi:preprotein translocase subunit SecE
MNMAAEELKAQDPGTSDKVKLAVAGLLVCAGVAGYYLLGDEDSWLRWLAVAGGIAAAGLAVAWSRYGRELWHFIRQSRAELRKVVWPNRQETGMTTLAVFFFVLVAGFFFWALDLVLAWATRALTGQGG